MSRTLVIEPLYCSQGGIPYNKAHLDAKDAEIARLKRDYAALELECASWKQSSTLKLAEIERLADLLENSGMTVRELLANDERLRAALEQAVDDFGEGHCVCEQTKQECIAALKDTP